MANKNKNEKSLLQIQLENEAKAKEITDKDQILELNRAMIEGKDLDKAAKNIFGPGPDQKLAKSKEMKIKNPNQTHYNTRNYH